jgi:uncharacterized protein
MDGLKVFFFDTYAFFEIIEQNPNYKKYETNISIITTKLNLMELHYGLLKDYGKETADYYYNEFLKFVAPFDNEIIKESNYFRFEHKKKKLSYIDCLGYTIAKKRKVKLLTGDQGFEALENVEYVK